MSYGATRQLLTAGLTNPKQLREAMAGWSDEMLRLHAEAGIAAYEFVVITTQQVEAQQHAMDLAVAVAQARIKLHNAVAAHNNAFEKAKAADAVDPVDGVATE